jgi:hypothetical protein
MQMKPYFAILVSTGLTLSLFGCVLEDVPPENIGDYGLALEEPLGREHRKPQAGIDIVDGEIPLEPEQREVMALDPCPRGTYSGTIRGDLGTEATLTVTFSGPPERVTADVSITEGLTYVCYASYPVGAQSFTLTREPSQGNRCVLTGSGSVREHIIGIRVEGDRADPQFNGIAYLNGFWFCDPAWDFELSKI